MCVGALSLLCCESPQSKPCKRDPTLSHVSGSWKGYNAIRIRIGHLTHDIYLSLFGRAIPTPGFATPQVFRLSNMLTNVGSANKCWARWVFLFSDHPNGFHHWIYQSPSGTLWYDFSADLAVLRYLYLHSSPVELCIHQQQRLYCCTQIQQTVLFQNVGKNPIMFPRMLVRIG